jgi:dinuclear metal center YbgI/SA1388 family protein
MKIAEFIGLLETLAPPFLQEDYDNAGLITGSAAWDCKGVICCLDATHEVIKEAVQRNCNLIVAHHPVIFRGLKKLNGKNYVEKAVIAAVKNDIAIYAIHTNLDNVIGGVNGEIARRLGLHSCTVLSARKNILKKLFTFVPVKDVEKVRKALFDAGGGQIGNYSECSFNAEGEGTFKAGAGTQPYAGELGKRHFEKEIKLEIIFPSWMESRMISALLASHPYEEVAYDLVAVSNAYNQAGSGIVGFLPVPVSEDAFLEQLKSVFGLKIIRHSVFTGKKIGKVALCGGAGSFLISNALSCEADAFITADLKYHEFFDAEGRLLLADIGHYESEQFTIDYLHRFLQEKFTTFAVLKTGVNTNPVNYFI